MRLFTLLSLILLLQVTGYSYAQDTGINELDSLAGKTISAIRAADKEKIKLVTDRDIYAGGETLYFKAWLVDSIRNTLQSKPKRIFVDLADDSNKVVKQLLLNAATFKTNGSITLSETLAEGWYWLRAYTKKMAAANTQGIGIVPVYIINQYKQNAGTFIKNNTPASPLPVPRIQLFPEGGSIISGINTTIAVKATSDEGKPLTASGIVRDNHDTVVAKFTTNEQGLGKFSYYPKWFNKYTLYVSGSSNKDSVITLPPVNFFAAQISVDRQNSNYVIARVALEDSIFSRNFVTHILGVSGDSLCFAGSGRGIYNANIPLNNFPPGKAKLLLFDQHKKLLSERSFYVYKKGCSLNAATNKDNYAARENVRLSLEVKDADNKPLLCAMAIAVTDSRITDTATGDADPLARLSAEDADLVMLTGTDNYQNILSAKPATTTMEEDSFTVRGKVLNKKEEAVSRKTVTILSNKQLFLVATDTTDTNGRFHFYLPDYYDSTAFSLQVSDKKGRKEEAFHILLDTVRYPEFQTPAILKKTFMQDQQIQAIRNGFYSSDSFFTGTGKGYLKTIVVKTYKKKEVNYDASKRISNFSHIITQDMIGAGPEMAGNALLMIPGVHLSQGLVMIGGPSGFKPSAGNEPLVVIDGIRISLSGDSLSVSPVMNFLNSLSFRTIDFIEVLTGAEGAIYGTSGGNGVILINTKSGAAINTNLTGLQSFYPAGFHIAKPFAMPDYTNPAQKKSKALDARTTIYWNGNLLTDKDGKATVNFFTADVATAYIATITAVTANGYVLHKTIRINRK